MATVCTMAWVYGSVQGVGFRYSTQREALQLGLTGYARNLDDGGVEVLACGEPEQVEKLIAAESRWAAQRAGGQGSDRAASAHQRVAEIRHFVLDTLYRFRQTGDFVACLAGPFGNRR